MASSAIAAPSCRKVGAPDLAGTPFAHEMKIARTTDGTTYRYAYVAPKDRSKPYILFTHGFPSSFYDWRHQITYFAQQGYGVIAPDMLGYGGTDKPSDNNAYRMKKMTAEVIEILDCEGIDKVMGVGHDWGSVVLSRLANYHSSRFLSFAFISNGYSPPLTNLTTAGVQAINTQTATVFGYAIFGYWFFFDHPGAPGILNEHYQSATSIFYTGQPSLWKTELCPVGALQSFVSSNQRAPPPNYISEAELRTHDKIISGEDRGYAGPLNWYKAALHDVNSADEHALPSSQYSITQPVLLVTGTQDPVALAAIVEPPTRKYASTITVQTVNTSHWAHIEAPDQVNGYLQTLFEQAKPVA